MKKIMGWDLNYFTTNEWQVVDERLKGLDQAGTPWCPGRVNLFRALDLVRLANVRVVLVGQDPYPNPQYATGAAFSIPATCGTLPPTLAMIIQELQTDVDGFTYKNGDLTPWCNQGVLLWNAIPSCLAFQSKSHHWDEYIPLTAEIFNRVSNNFAVFAFLGSTAAQYDKYVNKDKAICLYTAHPSPRAQINPRTRKPFLGSRIFSTINMHLQELGKAPIDWRL